jgi:putative transcription factor
MDMFPTQSTTQLNSLNLRKIVFVMELESLSCEVCGRKIVGKPARVVIEGAKLTTCEECAKLGEAYWETKAPLGLWKTLKTGIPPFKKMLKAEVLPKGFMEYELAEDYAKRIKNARLKLNISQEYLAKAVKEKLSLIQKIESGKIVPDMRLARLLEHALRIKLLVPHEEPVVTEPPPTNFRSRP